MSNCDAAATRLRVVRDLPVLLEAAFRAAAREMVFIRPASRSFAAEMKKRARFHLSWLVRESRARELPLGRAELALDRAVDRFSTTSLCRRLSALPVERLHAVGEANGDLIIDDGRGRLFALCFAGFSQRDVAMIVTKNTPAIDGIDAHLIYDIESARLRRISAAPNFRRRPISPKRRLEDLKVA